MNMKEEYPGGSNILNSIGIRPRDSVLILTDKTSDNETIDILHKLFSTRCSRAVVENLPLELQHDFPPLIRQMIEGFDVIILAASQSWYQAPTRRKAKYENKKRVVECYNLTLEMMKDGALCADYEDVRLFTKDYEQNFKPGYSLTIRTDKGSDLSAVITGVFAETGCYENPGSGGNLPAGEISLGVAKSTTSGDIVFDISFDTLGRLQDDPLKVHVDKGRVVEVSGRFKNDLENLFQRNGGLRNIAEIGIGTNSCT